MLSESIKFLFFKKNSILIIVFTNMMDKLEKKISKQFWSGQFKFRLFDLDPFQLSPLNLPIKSGRISKMLYAESVKLYKSSIMEDL